MDISYTIARLIDDKGDIVGLKMSDFDSMEDFETLYQNKKNIYNKFIENNKKFFYSLVQKAIPRISPTLKEDKNEFIKDAYNLAVEFFHKWLIEPKNKQHMRQFSEDPKRFSKEFIAYMVKSIPGFIINKSKELANQTRLEEKNKDQEDEKEKQHADKRKTKNKTDYKDILQAINMARNQLKTVSEDKDNKIYVRRDIRKMFDYLIEQLKSGHISENFRQEMMQAFDVNNGQLHAILIKIGDALKVAGLTMDDIASLKNMAHAAALILFNSFKIFATRYNQHIEILKRGQQ